MLNYNAHRYETVFLYQYFFLTVKSSVYFQQFELMCNIASHLPGDELIDY